MNKETDKELYDILYDVDGNEIIVPKKNIKKIVSDPGEFTIFDDSAGHCPFCGDIQCRGSCFK